DAGDTGLQDIGGGSVADCVPPEAHPAPEVVLHPKLALILTRPLRDVCQFGVHLLGHLLRVHDRVSKDGWDICRGFMDVDMLIRIMCTPSRQERLHSLESKARLGPWGGC